MCVVLCGRTDGFVSMGVGAKKFWMTEAEFNLTQFNDEHVGIQNFRKEFSTC